MHHEINFGPFATNVLDSVGRKDLCTSDGQKVEIRHYCPSGFTIYIGRAKVCEYVDNLQASYILNMAQVGTAGRE